MTKSKPEKSNDTLIRHFPIEKIPVWVRVTVIVFIVLLLVDNFITGYIKFTYNYIRCGHAPVAAVKPLSWDIDGYDLPGTSTYEIKAWNEYFCNRDEAEAAGFWPNQFSDEGRQRIQELEKQGKHPR